MKTTPRTVNKALTKISKNLVVWKKSLDNFAKIVIKLNKLENQLRKLQTDFDNLLEKDADLINHKTPQILKKHLQNAHVKFDTKLLTLNAYQKLQFQILINRQKCLAAMENQRKSKDQVCGQTVKHEQQKIFQELLKIVDLFVISLKFKPKHPETVNFLTGMNMTYQLLQKFLIDFNVTTINVKVGDSYDHNLHHAINSVNNKKIPNNVIVEIKQNGYLFKQQLLRPVQVVLNRLSNQPKSKEN